MLDTKDILDQLAMVRGVECTEADLKALINVVEQWQIEQPVKGSEASDAIRRMEMKFND